MTHGKAGQPHKQDVQQNGGNKMSIQTLTKENFTKEVEEAGAPVLVDFWAPWCGYCRRLAPALDAVASEWEGRLSIGKVDVDEQPELSDAFEILTLPSLVLFQNGKPSQPLVNPSSKAEIDSWLTEQGVK